jgi:hypothetical protein
MLLATIMVVTHWHEYTHAFPNSYNTDVCGKVRDVASQNNHPSCTQLEPRSHPSDLLPSMAAGRHRLCDLGGAKEV